MRPAFAFAAIMLCTGAAQAARIDDGPLPDIGRYITGCWVNVAGTLAAVAGEVSVCFEDGVVDTARLDASGQRLEAQLGSYTVRNAKIVLTGPKDAAWVFGHPTIICDVGVLPHVRLGLFDCVGSGALPDGSVGPADFLAEMRFTAQREATT